MSGSRPAGPVFVHECGIPAGKHLGLGRNVNGQGPNPYEPHAHPFTAIDGLFACCTGNQECRVEGHITRDALTFRHAIRPGD